ncbi:hypothetical protein G9A89_007878 [Geosiphon pyriformis]|nr:hypothetical protein G9A89_007878 [Geosiphon pyriformis]
MDDTLNKPRNITHTLYKLFNWMQMGAIDLSPDFQRGDVWTAAKQSHLIDSILNNYYVPPIIFSCKKLENKRSLRVCIDGKQRLVAIKRFMENEIPHSIPTGGHLKKRYYKRKSENDKRHLSDAERENFDCSELVCEKFQAISSPMVDYAQTLFLTFPNLEKIMNTKRGRPLQIITQTLHLIEMEPESYNVATSTTISKYLKDKREVPLSLKRTAKWVFETLAALIDADDELINRSNKLAPIEFVFSCLMISKYPNLSISQYQHYILRMKQHVRQRHIDIRFNNRVCTTLRRFVDDLTYEIETMDVVADAYSDNLGSQSRSPKRIKIEPLD